MHLVERFDILKDVINELELFFRKMHIKFKMMQWKTSFINNIKITKRRIISTRYVRLIDWDGDRWDLAVWGHFYLLDYLEKNLDQYHLPKQVLRP